jgi:hypothetical protein
MGGLTGARRGGRRGAPVWPVWPPVWPLIIAKPLQNHCKTIAKPLQNRCKTRRGQTGGPTGADGLDGGPDGARRGGRRKDYLFFKEKMTCSVYVSYKSSSASDVSDIG